MSLPTDSERLFAGRYRIRGDGGARRYCSLFPARDAEGRPFTLMVFDATLSRDEPTRTLLRAALIDAKALPHGAAVLQSGGLVEPLADDDPGAWVLFEELPGRCLEASLAEAPLELETAPRVALALADALVELHAQGRSHGALSPAWIWHRDDPITSEVRVVAPGVATILSEQGMRLASHARAPLTSELQFLSPEVMLGEAHAAAADVWAFALIVFELLTGARYWSSDPNGERFAAVSECVQGATEPASRRAVGTPREHALPRGFDAWFARCMSRDRAARPSMLDAGSELRALLGAPYEPPIILANPKGSFYDRGLSRDPRRWVPAAGVAIVVIGAVAGWLLSR